jgi:hypothetical protein
MRPRLVALLFATLLVSVGLLAVDDPLIGTWQLNLAKSKYNPGPPPRSQILNYTPFGNKGLKVRAEIADAQGNKTVTEYSANYDAKDYPVTGSPDADTVSMKHIDAATAERTYTKAGKVTTFARRAVSRDGKILTITINGANANGQRVNNVLVFDKQ